MSETRKKLSLDAALRDFPDSRKSASEWEDLARSIAEKATGPEPMAGLASIEDEKLFAAPLGQLEESSHNHALSGETRETESDPAGKLAEGKPMTMPADRERDRRSLQDLAKMAAMTPPPASVRTPIAPPSAPKSDDSGVVDLAAAAAADPHAPARAQATPLASQGLFDDVEPVSQRPPSVQAAMMAPASIPPPSSVPQSLPPGSLPPASLPPISQAPASFAPTSAIAANGTVQMAAAPSHPAVATEKKKGAPVLLVLGGLVAVGAIAAATFVGINMTKTPASEPVAAVAPPAPQPETPAAPTAAPEPPPAATAEATPAPAEDTVDPSALPASKGAKVALSKAPAVGAKAAPKAAAPEPAAKPEEKKEPAKLTAKDLPQGAAGGNTDLNTAMQRAAGPSASGDQKAAEPSGPQFAAGSVPRKPSQGAVTGAIGAVLSQARACVGPDDPVSRAAIVFSSGGAVQQVRVSGHAAGKPAEACIKAALGKAKLTPFAEPTYTANITIRH